MNRNRVVITGMGAITPVGNSVDAMWASIRNGRHGFAPITRFDASDCKVRHAAEIKDFNPEDHMDRKDARRMDRFCQFMMIAAAEAMVQANLSAFDPLRAGVVVGSGIGGFDMIEETVLKLTEHGANKVSPLFIPSIIINMAAGQISMKYGFKGISYSPVSACSTGAHSIGEAFRLIAENRCDLVVAGGSEAPMAKAALIGFTNMTALTKSDDVDRLSIPFDLERSGFVMAEGAGVLVLESLEHAQKRGAAILAEVVGYGATSDAYHMTAPEPSGEGAANAMRLAMQDAGLSPADIAYINAHGTSTPLNDKTETLAIKAVLGEYAYSTAISSSKSMMGHLLGAAGAAEAIITVKALQEGFVPPTAGYKIPDPECDLDYTPNVGKEKNLVYALSNSLGFGGHNVCLAFKAFSA